MNETELELALLERFLTQHKRGELEDPKRATKCARELDLRYVLRELTGEDGAGLDYEANLWMNRLTSPRHGKSAPLKRCSDSSKNGSEHRFHLRAYFEDSGLPAADCAAILREKTGSLRNPRRQGIPISLLWSENRARNVWEVLHPGISDVARERFESGHYADAVEAALKEVNQAVKAVVKERTGQEYDGANLMNRAFSPNNPVLTLADLSTQSGRDEQLGYMQLFAGAMTGIRNPKAHANIQIDDIRAVHHLFVASLLRFKMDEAS